MSDHHFDAGLDPARERLIAQIRQDQQSLQELATALERERELQQTVMENTTTQLAYLDPAFNFVRVNEAYARGSGYRRETLIGRNHFDLFPHAENQAIFEQVRDTGEPVSFHAKPFGFPDQPERGVSYWDWTLIPVKDARDQVQGLVLSLQDVTETVEAEQALRAERDRAQTYLDIAGVIVIVIASDQTVTLINRRGCEILGCKEDEIVGQNWFDTFIPERERKDVQAAFDALIVGEIEPVERFENAVLTKSGEERIVAWKNTVLRHETGDIIGTLSSGEDITERKRADRALQELAHDLGERVKKLNCLYGISSLVEAPGNFLERVCQGTVDLIPPAWQYPEICCARLILDGQEYRSENYQESPWQQSADIYVYGDRCGTLNVGYLQEMPQADEGPFLNEERNLINAIAERMGRITERKRSEHQLAQQHKFLQLALDSLTHPFYVINAQDYTVELANSAALHGELPGNVTCFALTHGQDRPCETAGYPCPLEEVKRTNKPVILEHVHLDDKGYERHYEVHGFPIVDSDGNVVQMIEYTLDITERKQAELALRESESRWRSLTQTSPDHILMLDTDLTIQFANYASPGLTSNQLVGTPLHTLVDKARQAEIRAILESVLRTGTPARYETVYHSPDGNDIYYESHVARRTLPGSESVVGLTLSARDITERKRADVELRRARDELELRVKERTAELLELNRLLRAEISERQHVEDELRTSEERFRQLADNIEHVFWITDLADNRFLYVSPAYEDLWGRAREDLYQQPAVFLQAIHPEDRGSLELALELGRHEDQSEQFRVVRPDGTVIWVRARLFPVRDEQGQVYRLAGIAEDISDQVQAVQLLEQHVDERTRQLSALLQIANNITLTLEPGPLLDLILDGLQGLVEYDAACIYELEGEELVAMAHRGLASLEELEPTYIHLAESATAQSVLSGQEPILLQDVRGSAGDSLLASVSDWACCGMAAPLGIRQRVIGLLILYSKTPQSYSPQEADLLKAFANQAAVGIENAHLYKQTHTLAVMEERQRLARDLHDAVSQTLFSANIIAEALPRIWDRDPSSVRQRLPQLHRLTSGALAEMRALLLELRPTALVDVELGELLQRAVDAFSGRSRTKASLVLSGQRPLPAEVQIALYRIAQEALNNVAKHAKAAQVKVHLLMEPDRVELRVRDDGQGFDPEQVLPGCMGLSILHERARAVGANLQAISQPGNGTEIVVVWTGTD